MRRLRAMHVLGTVFALLRAMTHARQRLGSAGESLACEALEQLGYIAIERNYRSRFGEIDLIMKDADTIVFVEVKTKTSSDFGDPVDEVTPQKQRQIASMGEEYHAYQCRPDTPCRFDVVSIHLDDGRQRIEVFQNAFDATV